MTLAVTYAFLFIPSESQCPDLEVLTKYFKVHLLQFQEFSIREHSSSQLPIPLLGLRTQGRKCSSWLPYARLVTSTWEPVWGDMSRCFFVPWGVRPPCFLSTFHSLPSDSLLLQPRGQVWRDCLNHTHTANPVINQRGHLIYVGTCALPLAPRHQEVTPASKEATPLIGITAICPECLLGTRHFTPCH